MTAGRTTRTLAAVAWCGLAGTAWAQDGGVPRGPDWTLPAAVERALATHPSLAAAEAEVARARAELEGDEAGRLPEASLSASAFRYDLPTIVTPIHGFTPGQIPEFDREIFQGGARLSYLLWNGGRRDARIEGGERRVAAAESGADGERQDLAAATVEAYLRVLTLAETAAAHEHRLEALESERSRVQRMFDAGRAAQVDLRRVEASRAAARAEQVALAVGLDRAERGLARLLEVTVDAARALRLEPVPTTVAGSRERSGVVARALEANPRVARAGEELEAARAALQLARDGRKPSLSVEGNVLGFASPDVDATTEWNAGLRLALPLFDRTVSAEVARAEAGVDAAEQRLALARLDVEAAVDRALADLAETAARAESLQEAVARWAEVVRVERLRLDNGVGIESDYLDAEAELLSARAAAAQARYGIVAARAGLARVEGGLTVEWLQRHIANRAGEPR